MQKPGIKIWCYECREWNKIRDTFSMYLVKTPFDFRLHGICNECKQSIDITE